MRTRSIWNRLLLVAVLGSCSWACQVKSSSGSGGSGGSETGGSGGSQAGGSGGDQAGGSGGTTGSGGDTGAGGAGGGKTFDPAKLPCDTYAEDGGPCVAAHSTIRRLLSTYSGPLYQVRAGAGADKSGTGGELKDIGFLADGFADGAAQVTACGTGACFISTIYDQSGKGNHLTVAPAGGAKKTPDNETNAKALPIKIANHDGDVYGVKITPGIGYRDNTPNGTATGDNPETMYMVVAGNLYNAGCCFDYGNAETNSFNNGEGTMEAVYFGNCTIWNKGGGDGPWIMGDLENGLWAGDSSPYEPNGTVPSDWKYITGMVKGDAAGKNHWTIKRANAQSGTLETPFDGARPNERYRVMRKEGAIILGTGGDNSSGAQGIWFEGIMTAHYSSNAADEAVQANIVSVYSKVQ